MTKMTIDLSEIPLNDLKEVYFGYVKYPKGGMHGPRIQRGLQFFYLMTGLVRFDIEGRSIVLYPGDLAMLLPGRHEVHYFSEMEESTHTWCQLDFYERPDQLQTVLGAVEPVVEANKELKTFMDLGLMLTRSQTLDGRSSLLTLGQSLVTHFIEYSASLSAGGRDQHPIPRAVRAVCDFLSEHFGENLSLEDMAAIGHVSINHLITLFKDSLQITPSRYLWRLRTKEAAALLRGTSIPVSHIAEQVGFASPYHFSRVFKQNYGVSPSAYRKQRL